MILDGVLSGSVNTPSDTHCLVTLVNNPMESLNTPGGMAWIPVFVYMCQRCVFDILWETKIFMASEDHEKLAQARTLQPFFVVF